MTTPNVKPLTSLEATLRLHAAAWDLAGGICLTLWLEKTAEDCYRRRDAKLAAADRERRPKRRLSPEDQAAHDRWWAPDWRAEVADEIRRTVLVDAPVSDDPRHRVYLPGPHADDAAIIHHGAGCDPAACPVAAAIDGAAERLGIPAADFGWQVQGEYFTTDGIDFTRCAWQPTRDR